MENDNLISKSCFISYYFNCFWRTQTYLVWLNNDDLAIIGIIRYLSFFIQDKPTNEDYIKDLMQQFILLNDEKSIKSLFKVIQTDDYILQKYTKYVKA